MALQIRQDGQRLSDGNTSAVHPLHALRGFLQCALGCVLSFATGVLSVASEAPRVGSMTQHSRALKQYLELGMKVTKVHRVIGFLEKQWMRPFVEFCEERRRHARDPRQHRR